MRVMSSAALGLVLNLILSSCMAHEAPTHEHADLVPVPEYSPPHGEASAAASLRAAQALRSIEIRHWKMGAWVRDGPRPGRIPQVPMAAHGNRPCTWRFMYDLDAGERAGRSGLSARLFGDGRRRIVYRAPAEEPGRRPAAMLRRDPTRRDRTGSPQHLTKRRARLRSMHRVSAKRKQPDLQE